MVARSLTHPVGTVDAEFQAGEVPARRGVTRWEPAFRRSGAPSREPDP
jgi:hypothetical protein